MNNTELVKNWKFYNPKEPIGDLEITKGQFMTGNMAGILITNETPTNNLNSIVNAKSFDFPVRYKIIDLSNRDNVETQIKQAISAFEHEGCRFIATSGGRFGEFHKIISNSTNLMALSSPLQVLPLLAISTPSDKKLVIVSDQSEPKIFSYLRNFGFGDDIISRCLIINDDKCIQTRIDDLCLDGIKIAGIIWDSIESDYCLRESHKFPVYSMVTTINLLKSACAQQPYYGYI